MDHHHGVGQHTEEHGASATEATRLVAVGLLVAAAWWIVALPPFTARAATAVVVTTTSAVVVGTLRRRAAHAGPDVAMPTVVPWLVLAGAFGAWQLAAFLQQPRADHPTISSLTNALLDTRPERAAAFVLLLVATTALARR